MSRVGFATAVTVLTVCVVLSTVIAGARVGVPIPDNSSDNSFGQPSSEQVPQNQQLRQASERVDNDTAEAIEGVDLQNFRLVLSYHGNADKPYYNLILSVPATAQRIISIRLAHRISEEEAAMIVQYLSDSGFFKHAKESETQNDPDTGPQYLLRVDIGQRHLRESLGWDLSMLHRLDGLHKALNGDAADSMELLLGRLLGHRRIWESGQILDDLKTTISTEKHVYEAGRPIPFKVELTNVGDQDRQYLQHHYVRSGLDFVVTDQHGRRLPYLGGGKVRLGSQIKIKPAETNVIESCDLSTYCYLRRPGRYTVAFRAALLPPSNSLTFEVSPGTDGAADGDPVGRLLRLVSHQRALAGSPNAAERMRPGSNRSEVPGWVVVFYDPAKGVEQNRAVILWLTHEEASERLPPDGDYVPVSEYLGKVSRWHLYFHATPVALEAWPMAKEDIKNALNTEPGAVTSADNSPDEAVAPEPPDSIEDASQLFRGSPKGPDRARAAKLLYPLIEVGTTRGEVLNLFGGPDWAKGGQLTRFQNYSIGEGQEIEVEFDNKTDLVVRKHEVGLDLDPPPADPLPIADNLKPFLTDYLAGDTTIRAGFVPYKAQLVWGEPLEVTFLVENLGPADFEFMFGGDYRGSGRHDRIKVTVTDENGKLLLPDPHEGAPNFGGLMSHEIVTPGGLVFTRVFKLTQFRTIDKPGEYTVTCSFAFDEPHTDVRGPLKPTVKSSFALSILERTPERVARVLDELVTQAETASDDKLDAAMTLIARFGKGDAVPRLIQLAADGPVPRRAAALGALPLAPGDASLNAAIEALKDADPAIRIAAASATGRFQEVRGAVALLGVLDQESSPVKDAVLIALGTSKSVDHALPRLAAALEDSSPALRSAAIQALVAFGGPEGVAALEKHVSASDLVFRYQVILALAEKLQQPIEIDWLMPILMCRTHDHGGWYDSLRLVRMYAGEKSIGTLLACLDFDVAWSGRNWWILNEVAACLGAPQFEFEYDPNSEGTPEQWEKNRRTLQLLRTLAGPIPDASLWPTKVRAANLDTQPPVDFEPTIVPVEGAVEIRSGFFQIRINRNGTTTSYAPNVDYRVLYQFVADIKVAIASPARLEEMGIPEEQAQQLRTLPLPPDFVGVDPRVTELYIAYRESPTGAIQQRAADDLTDLIRVSSQNYHAAVAAFAEAARKILRQDR